MAKAKATAKGKTAPAEKVEGGKYTRKRAVTMPVIKLVEEQPFYCKITSAMFKGKANETRKGNDGKVMEPATLCHVVNIETGEVGQIIVNAALAGILNDTYPGDAYVDKSFEIVKHAKAQGKRYNTFSVFEIEA